MNAVDAEKFLADSLADRKLSGGEKEALADWLTKNATTDQLRGMVRHTAFDLARQAVVDPEASRVIAWLEDVLRVIAPVQSASASPSGSGTSQDTAFFSPGDACWRHVVHRIEQARRTMDLCVFTITDDRISRTVLDAHKRGVRVRIISDNDKSADLGSDIQKFCEAGIPVKLDDMSGPSSSGLNGHMHHKFAIFDGGRMINGSYNWTRGAAETNYENIVDTTDAKLVAAFAAEFERLWKRF